VSCRLGSSKSAPNQKCDGILAGEDADDVDASADLAVTGRLFCYPPYSKLITDAFDLAICKIDLNHVL
jgi:hypothetical protein